MKRTTGIGGIFFKSDKPAELADWHARHLDLDVPTSGGVQFAWAQKLQVTPGYKVCSPFKAGSTYVAPGTKPWMSDLRLADLDALLAALRADGVQRLVRLEDGEPGRFCHALDPEGKLPELWRPAIDDASST